MKAAKKTHELSFSPHFYLLPVDCYLKVCIQMNFIVSTNILPTFCKPDTLSTATAFSRLFHCPLSTFSFWQQLIFSKYGYGVHALLHGPRPLYFHPS